MELLIKIDIIIKSFFCLCVNHMLYYFIHDDRHPYFWADEKKLRFVLIAGSDVLRDMKHGFVDLAQY